MEKSTCSPYDLIGKSLFVQNLDSTGLATRLSDDQIRDKLTIHFQNQKLSHGGDVKEVIYPLISAKGCAVVVFEHEKELASVVDHEQIFWGQRLQVNKLPPVFSSVQAEIHPFYFQILATYDKISERFETVANVKVNRLNCSEISCSLPSQLDRVGEEVVHLMGYQREADRSLSNISGEFEAAGASNAVVKTDAKFQEGVQEAIDSQDNERIMSMSQEEPEYFSSDFSGKMEGLENQRSPGKITSHTKSDDNEEATNVQAGNGEAYQVGQNQDVISLDKYVYRYIQTFNGPVLNKLTSNLKVKYKESKTPGNVEAVILPSRAGISAEDVGKARDKFIDFYKEVFFNINRKVIDCSTITKREMEDAAKKTRHDFKADTLIVPVDGSPKAELIFLTRRNIEDVARKFRGYAGIKPGRSLRKKTAQGVTSPSQDMTTTGSHSGKEAHKGYPSANEQQRQVAKGGIPDDRPLDFVTDEGISVFIRHGDITKYHSNAVVIPAEPNLNFPTGGVGRAVWFAAGPLLQKECHKIIADRNFQPYQTSQCVVTPAFNLNYMYHCIIHAVIPSDLKQIFMQNLYATFHNCLQTAAFNRLPSLAIPLMGSGISKAPKRECAHALISALLNFSRETSQSQLVTEVHLVNIDADSAAALKESLESVLHVPDSRPKESQDANDWPALPNDTVASHHQSHHDVSTPEGSASGPLTGSTAGPYSKRPANGASYRSVIAPASNWQDVPGKKPQEGAITTHPKWYSASVGGVASGQPMREATGQTVTASDELYGNQRSSHKADLGNGKSTTESTSAALTDADHSSKASDDKHDDCPICLSTIADTHVLPKCKHKFCKSCIEQAMETVGNTCPVCRKPCGEPKGNQPDGNMSTTTSSYYRLSGYPYDGVITINYDIPSGTQSRNHPNPGQRFQGARRTAYLPDNAEGREVLALLKKAFDARLIFTVGRSVTSGAENVVTWNDINHKTNRSGGPQNYGYPDPDYLKRVKEDLAAKGIV